MPIINGQFVDKTTLQNSGATISSQQGSVDDRMTKLNTVFAALIAKNPKQVTALESIYQKLKPKEETEAEIAARKKKEDAERVISQLEDFYFNNKLYYGNNTIKGFYGNTIAPSLAPDSPAAIYKSMLISSAPYFAKSSGDVGNIAVQEQLQAIKPFPTTRFNKTKAIESFQQIRKKYGLPEKDYGNLGIKALGLQFGGK